ncbi:MAG TPA: hypothetical protein VNO43_02700 [Candidatus Eisenbacteria bacterium]|nr:hypothetical protein [Candidatus Eisenbacteria bacterium]
MKTLTITDAKKNLGRWLTAAVRGEDIGIICGSDIVALRKVNVESTDYARREYGATPEQVAALEKATGRRRRSIKRTKELDRLYIEAHKARPENLDWAESSVKLLSKRLPKEKW